MRRFRVSAYPSLLVLGPNDENIHRFQGYSKPHAFLAELLEGLRRWELYRAGEPWDRPTPRPAEITDAARIDPPLPAPSEGMPSGIVRRGDLLWVLQDRTLHALDAAGGSPRRVHAEQPSMRDLCTDGELLYGLEYGWTAGKPIHVIDPASGAEVRAIVTEANRTNRAFSGAGIEWRDGRLYVLTVMGQIHVVDPDSGVVERVLDTGLRYVGGLAFDGSHFALGGRDALHLVDPASGAVVRSIAMSYPLRVVAWDGERYLLMEQPVFGFDRDHQRVRVWPRRTVIHRVGLPPAASRRPPR